MTSSSLSPRPALRLLALASLALNLFLLAMLAGNVFKSKETSHAMPDRLVEKVTAEMAADDREKVRRAFDRRRAAFEALTNDTRIALEHVRAVAGQEPLDPAALRNAIDIARGQRRLIGDLVEEVIVGISPELSPTAREQLVGAGK
jgi:uncharacterized membrane protein